MFYQRWQSAQHVKQDVFLPFKVRHGFITRPNTVWYIFPARSNNRCVNHIQRIAIKLCHYLYWQRVQCTPLCNLSGQQKITGADRLTEDRRTQGSLPREGFTAPYVCWGKKISSTTCCVIFYFEGWKKSKYCRWCTLWTPVCTKSVCFNRCGTTGCFLRSTEKIPGCVCGDKNWHFETKHLLSFPNPNQVVVVAKLTQGPHLYT